MSETDKPVDTTVDPTEKSQGLDADTEQNSAERDEAIAEFDGHLDGAGEEPSLPTPDPDDVGATPTDPKTITRSE